MPKEVAPYSVWNYLTPWTASQWDQTRQEEQGRLLRRQSGDFLWMTFEIDRHSAPLRFLPLCICRTWIQLSHSFRMNVGIIVSDPGQIAELQKYSQAQLSPDSPLNDLTQAHFNCLLLSTPLLLSWPCIIPTISWKIFSEEPSLNKSTRTEVIPI